MFLGWGFRVRHQHHVASFSYLADIILTISTTPHSHRHVQCTLYKHNSTQLWGSEEHTTIISQHWSTRLVVEGGSCVSRILLISHRQNHTNTTTHKHMRSHYWKTPTKTLRTTHRNPKTRTHQIKTSIKTHMHWKTLQFFSYWDFMSLSFVLQSAQYPANP